MNAEQRRLEENKSPDEPWHFWGPYLAERAWGTVREDYSANGDAWNYFPHDHARSRAYRWNEDGIGGISDYKGRLCFAFGFWNERDPFLLSAPADSRELLVARELRPPPDLARDMGPDSRLEVFDIVTLRG